MKPDSKKIIHIRKDELEKLITVSGFTQKKIATICGFERRYVWRILQKQQVKKLYLLRLARAIARLWENIPPSKFTAAQKRVKDIIEKKLEIRFSELAKKKIHAKNEFELCYLRHQYIRKSKHQATQEEMKPFLNIANYMAKNTFFVYKNLFLLVGLDLEDIVSIAHVHLSTFLGLFSLEQMPEKYKEFVRTFKHLQSKEPEKEDLLDKNKANLTLFLKQRMEDVVRVCRQKARNIKGLSAEEYFYYYGPNEPPKFLDVLVKNYEKMGYRKLDTAIFKSIRKRAGKIGETIFFFDKNYYIAVPTEKRSLHIEDLNGANLSPYDNLHNMTPEDVYFTLEDTSVWEEEKNIFKKSSKTVKAKVIESFIEKNKGNPRFEEEIKIARKMLKELS